jgi:hypothetical protein
MFKVEPAKRFRDQFGVEEKVWRDLWHKRKMLDYSITECVEWFSLETQKDIGIFSMIRWFDREEIYLRAQVFLARDIDQIDSKLFNEFKTKVEFLLNKNKQHNGRSCNSPKQTTSASSTI